MPERSGLIDISQIESWRADIKTIVDTPQKTVSDALILLTPSPLRRLLLEAAPDQRLVTMGYEVGEKMGLSLVERSYFPLNFAKGVEISHIAKTANGGLQDMLCILTMLYKVDSLAYPIQTKSDWLEYQRFLLKDERLREYVDKETYGSFYNWMEKVAERGVLLGEMFAWRRYRSVYIQRSLVEASSSIEEFRLTRVA